MKVKLLFQLITPKIIIILGLFFLSLFINVKQSFAFCEFLQKDACFSTDIPGVCGRVYYYYPDNWPNPPWCEYGTESCDCGSGGTGGGAVCYGAALSNVYKPNFLGACQVAITHRAYDDQDFGGGDGSMGGYRDRTTNILTNSRRIGVNSIDNACLGLSTTTPPYSEDHLIFTNDWSASSGRDLHIATTIEYNNAGHGMRAGEDLTSSNCTINDCITTSITDIKAVGVNGCEYCSGPPQTGNTSVTLFYCGDGQCACGEDGETCPADCPPPTGSFISISPNPCNISSGNTACTSTISYNFANLAASKPHALVCRDSGLGTPQVPRYTQGTSPASFPDTLPPGTYNYYLRTNNYWAPDPDAWDCSQGTVLDTEQLIVNSPAAPPVTPTPTPTSSPSAPPVIPPVTPPPAPNTPNVTALGLPCILTGYSGYTDPTHQILISWTNNAEPVTWVDISKENNFTPYYHKGPFSGTDCTGNCGSPYSSESTDGAGFTLSTGPTVLTYTPGATYYIRLFNGSHSPTFTFTTPSYCPCPGGLGACGNNIPDPSTIGECPGSWDPNSGPAFPQEAFQDYDKWCAANANPERNHCYTCNPSSLSPWIQTTGDVHSNTNINAPGGPPGN